MSRPVRLTAIITASAALAACGTAGPTSAAAGSTAGPGMTLTYYAFNLNNQATGGGFIPVPGTSPRVLAQGDELIINDQLTTTTRTAAGYPITGYDAGTCTVTRAPQQPAGQALADCAVTAAWKDASLTVHGVLRFRSRRPEPAQLAITGGTGRLDHAAGTVRVSFTKNFKILTFTVK